MSAGLAAIGCGSADDAREPGRASSNFFPQSVASGDPRPESVVLWTRVVDGDRPNEDLELTLTLALDEEMRDIVELGGAPSATVVARALCDHCVKVRVDSLEPGTTYFYRFRYESDDGFVSTVVGRTRTAPPPEADARVRFAAVSCQDYERGYYHLYRLLADQDLDFVVHLGDYVYETTNEPRAMGARRIVFGHAEQALRIEDTRLPEGYRLAARSLDNYRDLYRTVRTDPDLQRLHERFAMIVISDDHEFSNDCHGATATYEDGRSDETDVSRRAASDQAWSEYMPLDGEEHPGQDFDPSAAFPRDLTFFRRFVFGHHVELVMTDLRRYRADHVVPEDAFPGALFALTSEIPESDELVSVPSVDVDGSEYQSYGEWLRQQADALGFRPEALAGRLSVPFVNAQIDRLAAAGAPEPIDPETPDLVRGYAFHQLLKTAEFSSAGSRYLVGAAAFEAFAHKRFAESAGRSERMMGDEQRAWFLETLRASTRTFKLWGSSVCFMSKQIDVRDVSSVPEDLQARILLTAEDWDGCPNERAALLRELSDVDDVVVLSGDLHCFFVGTPFDGRDSDTRIVEIVTGAVSSSPWLREIVSVIESDPTLPPSVALVASAVGSFLSDPVKRPNPHMAFHDIERNGVTIVTVNGDALEAELIFVSSAVIAQPPAEVGDVAGLTTRETFRVRSAGGLERDLDGRTFRWDGEAGKWSRA